MREVYIGIYMLKSFRSYSFSNTRWRCCRSLDRKLLFLFLKKCSFLFSFCFAFCSRELFMDSIHITCFLKPSFSILCTRRIYIFSVRRFISGCIHEPVRFSYSKLVCNYSQRANLRQRPID